MDFWIFFQIYYSYLLSVPGATISKSQFSGIMYCLYLKKKYWLVYWIEIVGFFFKYNNIIDYISLLLISNQPNNYKPLLEDFLNVLLLAFFKIYINIVVFVHFHNMSLFRCDINMTYTYVIWYQAYISFVSLWSISKLQVKRHAHWQYIAIHTRWSTVSTTSLLGTWSTFNRLINRPNFSSSLPVDFRMSSVDPVDVPFFSSAVAVSDISAPFTMQTPRYYSPSRVNLELSRNTHTNA